MDACAERIIGGEVYLSVGDSIFRAIGDVTIEPTTLEREAGSTADGRVWVTEKSKPARFKCDFANLTGNSDPMVLWAARCNVNVTVVEKSRDIRHLFTAATIIGNPDKNLQTGVISGIEGVSDQYSTT